MISVDVSVIVGCSHEIIWLLFPKSWAAPHSALDASPTPGGFDGSRWGPSTRLGCLWELVSLQCASHHGLFVSYHIPAAHPSLQHENATQWCIRLASYLSHAFWVHVWAKENLSLFDGQSSLFPCRHVLPVLAKSSTQASSVNCVLHKHSKNVNMKICVNNSLATEYSISQGWVFFCQPSRHCPMAGGRRCVSPWETWPGEFPGRREKQGHIAWVSAGRPLTHLIPLNTIFQSIGVCSGFGKQLEIVAGLF